MTEASSLVGDAAKRDQKFKDAEKILVEDVGAIFIYHATPGNIYKTLHEGLRAGTRQDWRGCLALAQYRIDRHADVHVLRFQDVPATRK